MNPAYVAAIEKIGQLIGDTRVKLFATTAVVAGVAAYEAPFPSGQHDAAVNWFGENCLPGVRQVISELNEMMPCNVQLAMTLARGMWMVRYQGAFPTFRIEENLIYDFFCSMSGADEYIDQESYKMLSEHRHAIIDAIGVILNIRRAANVAPESVVVEVQAPQEVEVVTVEAALEQYQRLALATNLLKSVGTLNRAFAQECAKLLPATNRRVSMESVSVQGSVVQYREMVSALEDEGKSMLAKAWQAIKDFFIRIGNWLKKTFSYLASKSEASGTPEKVKENLDTVKKAQTATPTAAAPAADQTATPDAKPADPVKVKQVLRTRLPKTVIDLGKVFENALPSILNNLFAAVDKIKSISDRTTPDELNQIGEQIAAAVENVDKAVDHIASNPSQGSVDVSSEQAMHAYTAAGKIKSLILQKGVEVGDMMVVLASNGRIHGAAGTMTAEQLNLLKKLARKLQAVATKLSTICTMTLAVEKVINVKTSKMAVLAEKFLTASISQKEMDQFGHMLDDLTEKFQHTLTESMDAYNAVHGQV